MGICTRRIRRLAVLAVAVPFAAGCGAVVDAEGEASGKAAETGLPADVAKAGKLVVATGDYKVPTHFRDKSGKLVGFNIDLSRALGRELGIELELKAVPFDAVLAGIQAGRYDTALYNVSDSAERREVMDFVDYARSGSVVVARKGEGNGITGDPLSLCGLEVALTGGQHEFQVLSNQVAPKCAQASKPKMQLRAFANGSAAQSAVESGRTDVLVDGMTTTPYMVSENADTFELIGKLEIDADPLGMPFAKGRTELVTAVQRAWQAIFESGEYGRIAEKWSMTEIVPRDAAEFRIATSS